MFHHVWTPDFPQSQSDGQIWSRVGACKLISYTNTNCWFRSKWIGSPCRAGSALSVSIGVQVWKGSRLGKSGCYVQAAIVEFSLNRYCLVMMHIPRCDKKGGKWMNVVYCVVTLLCSGKTSLLPHARKLGGPLLSLSFTRRNDQHHRLT